jgi:hypothetical protein
MRRVLLAGMLLASCKRQLSTTDLRLEIRQEGGHEWVEVIAPPKMLGANAWIAGCRAMGGATRVEVIYQSPRIVSFACRGGATPALASFKIATGAKLTLDDAIQKDKSGAFQTAVVKATSKRGLPEPSSPPRQFALTAAGFVFETNGVEVTVPSVEMRPLLTPDAALLLGR